MDVAVVVRGALGVYGLRQFALITGALRLEASKHTSRSRAAHGTWDFIFLVLSSTDLHYRNV